jgi:hypothetical protein
MITAALSHCEIKIVVRLRSRRFQAAARASRRDCIQAIVMNVFGSIDNLAWIWVSKKRLDVHHYSVGLIPKCKTFRETLSLEMQGCLHKLEPWFDYIVDYRDALAHRIPLFIAPYIVRMRTLPHTRRSKKTDHHNTPSLRGSNRNRHPAHLQAPGTPPCGIGKIKVSR